MSVNRITVQRPRRWDAPFDPQMTDQQVNDLMALAPFCEMDESSFSKSLPLRDILKKDCRVSIFHEGDIVIRSGEYGNSAFLILDGELLVSLAALPPELLGRQDVKKKSWLNSLAQTWSNSTVAESRAHAGPDDLKTGTRTSGEQTRVFIQDIPGTIDLDQTGKMTAGQLFGELAALTRTPRSATVVAGGHAGVLEMRWQGFRDLMKRDPALRSHVDQLYRKHSLSGHLESTPELAGVDDKVLQQLATATTFESVGNFEWNQKFRKLERQDVAERIQSEPLVASEGSDADALILIRNGFARLSRQHGDGHQTIAYLGKGQTFGFREIAHNWQTGDRLGYSMSLRAVGYLDILRIPADLIGELVLPNIREDRLPALLKPSGQPNTTENKVDRRLAEREQQIDTGLLEFLVESRFINGTEAMLIDMDRCTRCDDCVRACAATHDNNPRFLRQGPQHDNWMVAGACMHCVDPVCMIGCPTGAIGRDEKSGSVVIHDQTCIGCGTCANSCPYDNIRMVEIRNRKGQPLIDQDTQKPLQKATKCDFCVEQNGGPACQRACPHDALFRVDLTTPSTLFQLTQQ